MFDPALIHRIRTIFLHQRPHVSIAEATVLLGWSRSEMGRAVKAGEVEVMSTDVGTWIWREELMARALELFEGIEEALGADAEAVLPEGVRLTELRVRVPRYQIAMLEYFAERERTTVSSVLARELDGAASGHVDELSAMVPGFAEGWRGRMRRGRGYAADGYTGLAGRLAILRPGRPRSNRCRPSSPRSTLPAPRCNQSAPSDALALRLDASVLPLNAIPRLRGARRPPRRRTSSALRSISSAPRGMPSRLAVAFLLRRAAAGPRTRRTPSPS